MAELGKINPIKRMACPSCTTLLPDWSVDEILSDKPLKCPRCRARVKLPDEVMDRARAQRSLGNNLDITC